MRLKIVLLWVLWVLGTTFSYAADKERIIVTGNAATDANELAPYPINTTVGGNASAFMRNIAGGDLNTNGQLSGLPQYRGMFGPRMNVRINDTYISPGGPVWMDPPMHYAPKSMIDSIEMQRGIAPVSSGPGIGGHINVNLKTSSFAETEQFEMQSDLRASGHSVDEGYNTGFIWAVANNRHRLHISGSRDEGNDTHAGDGEISNSEYARDSFGLGYGLNKNGQEFSFDFRRINTGDTNALSLPMDIDYYHSSFGRGEYKAHWGEFDVRLLAHRSVIDHRMDNYSLRPAPDFDNLPVADAQKLPPFRGTDRRYSEVFGDTDGFSLQLSRAWMGGEVKFGVDSDSEDHSATVYDPDVAAFYIRNIGETQVDRLGIFAEWQGQLAERWGMEIGVRHTQVDGYSDQVQAFPADLSDRGTNNPVTDNVKVLRDRFNGANRRKRDRNIDAVVGFAYRMDENIEMTLTGAHKTRSPNYVERYLWIPLEINSGLGDGNNYIGDPDLDPEISYELELGLDWKGRQAYFQPRLYYRWIDDFIQGVAVDDPAVVAVSNLANGDPNPKQFANVDAEIYGLDAYFGYRFNPRWHLDGLFGIVRGRRRDIDDNLFRISPPKLMFSLTREIDLGDLIVETVLVSEQDKLARSLLDAENLGGNINVNPTPGYALLNLRSYFKLPGARNLKLHAGIENVLDKHYHDHTATFNRIQGGDVPVGERLPGAGRGIYADLEWQW